MEMLMFSVSKDVFKKKEMCMHTSTLHKRIVFASSSTIILN